MTRQSEAPTTSPQGPGGLLVALTAGVGSMWALVVLGVGTVRAYNAWALHQMLVTTAKAQAPGVTHWSGLGVHLLLIMSALDFLVLLPLTSLWLVLTIVVFFSGRRGQSGRLYLVVAVVAVGASILLSVARAAAGPPSDLFQPALLTPTIDFSMLLALDGLLTLVASVWFWRRARSGLATATRTAVNRHTQSEDQVR